MKVTAHPRHSAKQVMRRLGMHRFSMVQLLVVLAVLLIAAPFVEELQGGHLILSVLFSLVLLAAVVVVAQRKRSLAIALLFAVPALTARWINQFRPDLVHPAAFLVCALLLLAFVIGHLLHFILQASVVTVDVLCASVAVYLMLGLTWTVAYWLVDQLTPGGAFSFNTGHDAQSMNGFTGLYFSFITLSTVGYGDITPVSRAARWLAATEAMTGLLYVAVLIARLVSLYSRAKSENS